MRTNPPAPNGGDAAQKLDRRVDQTADQAHERIDEMSNKARPMVDKLAGRAHNAVDKLESKSEEWLAAEQEMLGDVQAYVREKPLQALAIAVAGGFLLSRIIGSR